MRWAWPDLRGLGTRTPFENYRLPAKPIPGRETAVLEPTNRGPCAYLIPYMDPVPQTDGTSAHAAGAVPRRRRELSSGT